MRDLRLGGARSDVRVAVPGIDVSVKVDHSKLAVDLFEASKDGKKDGVCSARGVSRPLKTYLKSPQEQRLTIPSQGDDARMLTPVESELAHAALPLGPLGGHRSSEESRVCRFDLIESEDVVVWRDGAAEATERISRSSA